MKTEQLRFGDVISECTDVIGSHITLIISVFAVITVIDTALDLSPAKNVANFSSFFFGIFGQYLSCEAILQENVHKPGRGKRRYAALFVASLISGLAVVAGFFLLILPAVYLVARWSIATPLIIVEEMSGRESLTASWRATKAAHWTLFFVILAGVGALGGVVFVTLIVASLLGLGDGSVAQTIILNALATTWLVGGWILGVAIFRCLKRGTGALEQVFA